MGLLNSISSLLGTSHSSITTPAFSNSLTTENVSTPQPQSSSDKYTGGTLSVTIKRSDTQETFARRGLHDHAVKAGLGETEANEFAAKWTNKQTTLKHYENGSSKSYTTDEFATLTTKGTATFELAEEYDAEILADLNERVAYNEQFKGESVPAYTPEERAAMQREKMGVGQDKTALQNKPVVAMIDAKTRDGKPLTEDAALTRYIERTYNKDGRVWGDKINEMASVAKTNGVKVEGLQISEDGQTATFGISDANKQKLDRLFNQALGETITGEQASIKGQQEATNQVVDTGKMYANGAINTVNHITEPVRGVLEVAGVDTSAAKLPKLEYKSEIGKKYGTAGEMGTEIGIIGTAAPGLLKTTAGKVVSTVSGVYNVSTGAAGVDPTEKDAQGNARQMGTFERGVRIVGGAVEVFGARPTFSEAGTTASKTARQTEEVIEAVTNEGVVVRTKVPTNTATEAATAKPLQTADDLNSKIVTVDSNGNPSGTRFRSDYEDHIKTRDFSKASQRAGVNGCHDMKELEQYDIAVNSTLSKDSIKIASKTPHPTVKGVYKVEYQMPALDTKGQLTGAWRNKKGSDPFVKTVYDSSVIPDAQMAQWGREAFADAVQKGTINITNRSWEGTASNGIKLGGHLDAQNNSVRTFFVEF